jgi:hypothetical protein
MTSTDSVHIEMYSQPTVKMPCEIRLGHISTSCIKGTLKVSVAPITSLNKDLVILILKIFFLRHHQQEDCIPGS